MQGMKTSDGTKKRVVDFELGYEDIRPHRYTHHTYSHRGFKEKDLASELPVYGPNEPIRQYISIT